MTNNNGCIISGEIDKGEIFKEFSTKFVSTVATSESDRSENAGGTRDGWLLIEAIRQFDKDWSRTFFYYMNALELEDPKDLIRKLDGKVHMFRDGEKKLRVAVIKTEGNSDVMNLIDSAISRRKNKRNSRHRVAFSDYSYRRLASTYQHHIRPPLFNYSFYRPIYYNDLDQPARLERINDVQVGRNTDIGAGLGRQQQGHSQEELRQDGLSQENLDTVSTISSASEDHKAPPFLDESRLLNCSATKKLRFLPQYFEKIYAANKEWLSNKKNKKNSIKNSNSSLSSSGSSAECIISRLCFEFAELKIFD
uniref:Uncharacterized protein n=1 Tax=Meloidogyne enterolobii TaxID=390850 RepID=A0A6V7V120_MELEN|nr:unnamed protein product [Meloidogyne enterolobii]